MWGPSYDMGNFKSTKLAKFAAWLALVRQRTDKAPDVRLTFEAPSPILSAKEGKFYGAVQSPSQGY